MIGQLSSISLEIVALVVGASMVLGAIDILRQPGWAWKQAGEPQVAYLILDLILPVIGLAMYIFRARPKVVAQAAGDAPSPVVEPPDAPARSEPVQDAAEEMATDPARRPIAATDRFTGFREVGGNGFMPAGEQPAAAEPEQPAISNTFFSTGAATRSLRHPLALARGYRPRQRTSLTEDLADEPAVVEPETEPVVAVDPEPAPAPVAETRPAPTMVTDVVDVVEAVGLARVAHPAPAPAAAATPEAVQVPVFEPEPEAEPVAETEPVTEAEPVSTAEPVAAAERVTAPQPEPIPVAVEPAPTIPSGWKVDPSGRHQFRYWDGFHWTANVADDGRESLDTVSA